VSAHLTLDVSFAVVWFFFYLTLDGGDVHVCICSGGDWKGERVPLKRADVEREDEKQWDGRWWRRICVVAGRERPIEIGGCREKRRKAMGRAVMAMNLRGGGEGASH